VARIVVVRILWACLVLCWSTVDTCCAKGNDDDDDGVGVNSVCFSL